MLLNNNRVTLDNGRVRVLEVNAIRLGVILNTVEPCLYIFVIGWCSLKLFSIKKEVHVASYS